MYEISRIYIYILSQLFKKQSTYNVAELLNSDCKLLKCLKFPVLNNHSNQYHFGDNIKELEQVFIRFCLRYSLLRDKKVDCKVNNFKVALCYSEDDDAVQIIKETMETFK